MPGSEPIIVLYSIDRAACCYPQRVDNDETALLELIGTVVGAAAGAQVCWATDLNAGGAAMLIALLAAHDQDLLYLPGRIVHHAAVTYRGDGKTDAKDARIIADQARMRTDLQPVRRADLIATDLRLLTARRTDVICDRVRAPVCVPQSAEGSPASGTAIKESALLCFWSNRRLAPAQENIRATSLADG